MLILQDVFAGVVRFDDFLSNLGIPSHTATRCC